MTLQVEYFSRMKKSKTLWFLIFSTCIGYAAYVHSFFGSLDLYVAYYGFSALDFSNSVLYADYLKDDYPGGAWSTGKSILSWVYPFFISIGIEPIYVMYTMIFLEIFTLCAGVIALSIAIKQRCNYFILIVLCLFFVFSWARLPNLAKFNNPYFHGQFYGFSDGLVLLSIALYLKERASAKFVFPLTMSFLIHPIKSLFGYVSVGIFYLIDCINAKKIEKNSLVFILLSLFVSIVWYFAFITSDLDSPMSKEAFFYYSKLLNFHWYPEKISLFSDMYYRYAIPYISAVVLFYVVLVNSDSFSKDIKLKLALLIISLNIIAFIGIVNSYFEISTFLTKASIQRSSVLVLSIISIVFVIKIEESIRKNDFVALTLELAILSVVFLEKTSWPVLGVLTYTLYFLFRGASKSTRLLTFSLMLILLFVEMFIFSGYSSPEWLYDAYYQAINNTIFYMLLAAIVYVAIRFFPLGLKRKLIGFEYYATAFIALIFIFNLSLEWSNKNRLLKSSFLALASDYKEAQEWAKNNTDSESIFLLDPCYLGWRDFSQRGSFGNVNEWLKTGWLYTGSEKWLNEGLKRANIFGVNDSVISKYANERSNVTSDKYCEIARQFYYGDDIDFKNLSRIYDISYVVSSKPMNKLNYLKFSNNNYYIYKID